MTSIYDAERLDKIAQIVPQFSKVAEKGDTVMLGLEGDPSFPVKYRGDARPTATIVDKEEQDDELHITLKMSDGTTKRVSSWTISPYDVWEYTDAAFRDVMERETRKQEAINRAEASTFRGVEKVEEKGDTKELIKQLRAEIDAERSNMRSFQNTIITSLQEMAGDILNIDKAVGGGNRAEFSTIFRKEYAKMDQKQLDPIESAYRASSFPTKKTKLSSKATPKTKPMSTKKSTNTNIFSDSDSMGSQSDSDVH
jgi:hypothetical protein